MGERAPWLPPEEPEEKPPTAPWATAEQKPERPPDYPLWSVSPKGSVLIFGHEPSVVGAAKSTYAGLSNPLQSTWEEIKGLGRTAQGFYEAGKRVLTLPHEAATGQIDPLSEEGLARAREAAMFLSPMAPRVGLPVPVPPKPSLAGPFGVVRTEGERTGDLAARGREQAAVRGQYGGPRAQKQAEEFGKQREGQLESAEQQVTESLSPTGRIEVESPQEAGAVVSRRVQEEEAKAKGKVSEQYKSATEAGGEINIATFDSMGQRIRDGLERRAENPIYFSDKNTPSALAATEYIDKRIAQLKERDPVVGGVRLNMVNEMRKDLSTFRRDAWKKSEQDGRAASAVVDAFDEYIDNAVNSGMFGGDKSAITAWNNARAAHADYRSTFRKAAGYDPVGNIVEKIIGKGAAAPEISASVADHLYGAQGVAPSSLNVGVANRVKQIFGEASPEWTAVKQGLFQRLTEGRGSGSIATRLDEFLTGKGQDMARAVYSEPERAMLEAYRDMHRTLEVPRTAANWSNNTPIVNAIERGLGKINQKAAAIVGGTVGAYLGHRLGLPFSEAIGTVIGGGMTKAAETIATYRRVNEIKRQMPLVADAMKNWAQAVDRAQKQKGPVFTQDAAVRVAERNLLRLGSPFGITKEDLNVNQTAVPTQSEKPAARARGGTVSHQTEANLSRPKTRTGHGQSRQFAGAQGRQVGGLVKKEEEESPFSGETPLPLPGQSPGLGKIAETNVPFRKALREIVDPALRLEDFMAAEKTPAEPITPNRFSPINALQGALRGLSQARPLHHLIEQGKQLETLPERALQAAGTFQRTGEYEPGPILEAALLPMGGTSFGAPKGALGAGPVLPGRTTSVIKPVEEAGVPLGTAERAAVPAEPVPGGQPPIRPGGETRNIGLEEAQRAAEEAAGSQQPLAGLPRKPIEISSGEYFVPGPNAQARSVAEEYMREAGLPYTPIREYVPIVEQRSKAVADAFEQMPHAPDDPRVQAAYRAMAEETLAQWRAIEKTGLDIDFIKPGQPDPYHASPRLATKDIRDNNHFWVYPTDVGIGGAVSGEEAARALANDPMYRGNPLFELSPVTIKGKQLLNNDVFRIVHDYFGHVKEGVGFRAAGEENAWRSHSTMYSDLARPAMTTETRGQNSWVNYGPHGERNRTAKTEDTTFAEQKMGLLPDWAVTAGAEDPVRGVQFWRENPPLEQVRQHLILPGDKRISTRFPTAVEATEDPLRQHLDVGLPEFIASPASKKSGETPFEKSMRLVAEYPGFAHLRGLPPEEAAHAYIKQMSDNMNYLYNHAPQIMRDRSPLWYDGANYIRGVFADRYGIPTQSASGAIAALSPQKDWFQNASLAERIGDILFSPIASRRMTSDMEAFFRSNKEMQKSDEMKLIFPQIQGKSLSQIDDPYMQALWVRLYDEAHNPREFRAITPEGQYGGYVLKDDGTPWKVAWGSLDQIGNSIRSYLSGGDMDVISTAMGERHKVRSFYNNIEVPNDIRFGDVTADTHQVAAAQLRPLSGKSPAVVHNLASTLMKKHQPPGYKGAPGSSISGVRGTYPLAVEATRMAAKEQGLLPRQMQSATWEPVRELFTDVFKHDKTKVAKVDEIWKAYDRGEISIDKARDEVFKLAGGIGPPQWAQPNARVYDPKSSSSYREDLPRSQLGRRRGQDTGRGRGGDLEPPQARATGGSVTGKLDRSYDVPYLSGISDDGKTVYIDRDLPHYLKVANKRCDVAKYLAIHERTEWRAMQGGMSYPKAHHNVATKAEHAALRADRINPHEYERVLSGYIKAAEQQKKQHTPPDLYKKPYAHDRAALAKLKFQTGGAVSKHFVPERGREHSFVVRPPDENVQSGADLEEGYDPPYLPEEVMRSKDWAPHLTWGPFKRGGLVRIT